MIPTDKSIVGNELKFGLFAAYRPRNGSDTSPYIRPRLEGYGCTLRLPTMNVFSFIRSQWTPIPPISSFVSPSDVEDKTIVITGANVGLGFEAAKYIAALRPGRMYAMILSFD